MIRIAGIPVAAARLSAELKSTALPSAPDLYSMKWDGEWQFTYELFRDLGIVFAALLILVCGLSRALTHLAAAWPWWPPP
jgi:hypothetical protein